MTLAHGKLTPAARVDVQNKTFIRFYLNKVSQISLSSSDNPP